MTYADDLRLIGEQADAELAALTGERANLAADLAAALERIAKLEAGAAPEPEPTPEFTVTVSGVQEDGGYGKFLVSWSGLPAGTTGVQNGRSAASGGGDQPWQTTDPATSTGRSYEWLVPKSRYTVTVTALPSGKTRTVTVDLPGYAEPTPVPDPPESHKDNRYGFMVFLGEGTAGVDKDIAGIIEAGGTWARLGMYDAGSFTSAGVFQPNESIWALFEYACKKARSSGLNVFWDAADTLRISNSLTDAQWIAWQSSMWRYMATRLGPWVDAWQVFNEHDGRNLRTFAGQDNTTAANAAFFRAALEGARNAIRAGGSNAPVGTTVFGYPINEDRIQRWFRFHDQVSVNMDYIGIHAYPEFNGPIFTQFMQRVWDRYRKPIAVLEFGVPDGGGYGNPADGYQRVGDGIVIQNDALLAVKDKLLAATLFSLRNRVQGGTGEGGFGILDNNWTKKAYWQRVVTSIKKW